MPKTLTGFPGSLLKKRFSHLGKMLIFFLVGTAAGCVTALRVDPSLHAKLGDALISFYLQENAGRGAVFAASLQDTVQLLLWGLCASLTLAGVLLVPVIALYFGFSHGFAVGLVAYRFGFSGVLYNLLFFLPRFLLLVPLVLGFLSLCFGLNLEILRRVVAGDRLTPEPLGPVWAFLALYTLAAAAPAVLACYLEALLSGKIALNILL